MRAWSMAKAAWRANCSSSSRCRGPGRRPWTGRSTLNTPTSVPSTAHSGANNASSGCHASSASPTWKSGVQVSSPGVSCAGLSCRRNRSSPHGSAAVIRTSHNSRARCAPSSAWTSGGPATVATTRCPSSCTRLIAATSKPSESTTAWATASSVLGRWRERSPVVRVGEQRPAAVSSAMSGIAYPARGVDASAQSGVVGSRRGVRRLRHRTTVAARSSSGARHKRLLPISTRFDTRG